MIKRLILTLTIFISFAIANNSLESKIAKLQTVPKEQRYKLMNQIKLELAKMNALQRKKALTKLKKNISTSSSINMHTHMHSGSKNINSNLQNITHHLINKTNFHQYSNTPKTPDKHKNPGNHKKPTHQKSPHDK